MIGSINNSASLRDTALTGIHNGRNEMKINASEIASNSTMQGENTKPLIQSLVNLKANVQQVEAATKVLQVSDEMIGTLLDIKT
jgi:DNA polymerase I-like protein with 3'-5' exonuclease and polymerase domains